MRPLRSGRREERESYGGHRLEGIFGYAPASPGPVSSLVDSLDAVAPGAGRITHIAMYIDATAPTPAHASDGTTVIHVLWTKSGMRAEILAGPDPHDHMELAGYDVHPGDTLLIPNRMPFALGAGIVAFTFASEPAHEAIDPLAWPAGQVLQPPHHGLNIFQRFNRRTICAANRDLLLERWKVSHPLDLALNPDRWHYLTNLVEPVALNWPGGSTLLGRLESRFLPAGIDHITIVPDGLGYVLVGTIPHLVRNVVRPLRAAGYDRSAIAALGVPANELDWQPG